MPRLRSVLVSELDDTPRAPSRWAGSRSSLWFRWAPSLAIGAAEMMEPFWSKTEMSLGRIAAFLRDWAHSRTPAKLMYKPQTVRFPPVTLFVLEISREHGRDVRKSTSKCRIRQYSIFRSEEHTSELQSPVHLVCRLLLEKKKRQHTHKTT